MKKQPGFVVAVLLATPFALVAQTPTPTPKSAAAGAYAPGQKFSAVQMQQGRVQTDADWNEQLQTCRRQNEALKKQMKSRANELEKLLRQLQAASQSADETRKSGQDHTAATRDAIRKMLDQVAEINRASSP